MVPSVDFVSGHYHESSKSCPNLQLFESGEPSLGGAWDSIHSQGSDLLPYCEIETRLESFLADPGTSLSQKMSLFKFNQRPVDVTIKASRYTKIPLSLASKVLKKLSVFAKKADDLKSMSASSASFHSDKMSMNTKVQIAVGRHVGSSNGLIFRDLASVFCGVASSLGILVSIPYVLKSIYHMRSDLKKLCETPKKMVNAVLHGVCHQPLIGHVLNIAACSLSINYVVTQNPAHPPMMIGLLGVISFRDLIGRSISLHETNQLLAHCRAQPVNDLGPLGPIQQMNQGVIDVLQKKQCHITTSVVANAMIVLGCCLQLIQPMMVGMDGLLSIPYLTEFGMGVYFLGIAIHLCLTGFLFCYQRQYRSDVKVIESNDQLRLLSDSIELPSMDHVSVEVLDEQPIRVATNIGEGKRIRQELSLLNDDRDVPLSNTSQRFVFHCYDSMSCHHKQQVWKTIAYGCLHQDLVDCRIVQDLRRIPDRVLLSLFNYGCAPYAIQQMDQTIRQFIVLKERKKLCAHNHQFDVSLTHALANVIFQLRHILRGDAVIQSRFHDYLMALSPEFRVQQTYWDSPQLRLLSHKQIEEQLLALIVS